MKYEIGVKRRFISIATIINIVCMSPLMMIAIIAIQTEFEINARIILYMKSAHFDVHKYRQYTYLSIEVKDNDLQRSFNDEMYNFNFRSAVAVVVCLVLKPFQVIINRERDTDNTRTCRGGYNREVIVKSTNGHRPHQWAAGIAYNILVGMFYFACQLHLFAN